MYKISMYAVFFVCKFVKEGAKENGNEKDFFEKKQDKQRKRNNADSTCDNHSSDDYSSNN